jgi:hypothetical protein
MRKQIKELAKWNKKRLEKLSHLNPKKFPYARKDLMIDTTEATIILNKLFPANTTLFIAFLIYRLRMDLGFTISEVCNFVGLTPEQVIRFITITQNLLYLKVFDILKNEDIQKEIIEFQNKRFRTGTLAWFNVNLSKVKKELGFRSRYYKGLHKNIKRWDFFHNNTYEHFKRWFGEWNKYLQECGVSTQSSESDRRGEETAKSLSETPQTQTVVSRKEHEGSGNGFNRDIVPQQSSEEIPQISSC